MKRILIICNKYPFPENTGTNIRTMNFVRFFQTLGEIDIAHLESTPRLSEEHPFRHEYLLKLQPGPKKLFKKMAALFKRKPSGVYNFTADSEFLLNSLLAKEKYDYIFIRYITTASSLLKLPEIYRRRMIIDVDDLPSDLYNTSSGFQSSNWLIRLKRIVNNKLLKSYERKHLNNGAVLFCSEYDRSKVTSGRTQDNTYIVPNVLSNPEFQTYPFKNGYPYLNQLLFVGTLQYKPNVDGLMWFIENIYKVHKAEQPDVKFNIIGRGPSDSLIAYLKEFPGIKLHSDVPRLEDFYNEAGIAIVPILSGGGTRIKILEAGLASRPVMTTTLGAHGLDVKNERDILIFNNSDEFMDAYQKLQSQEFYDKLTENLKTIVVKNFSSAAFNKAMQKVVRDIDQTLLPQHN